MNIENWATSPVISQFEYWEKIFPGHGAKILEIVSPFQGWKPTFGVADATLKDDILKASVWMGTKVVAVVPLDKADEVQDVVTVGIERAVRLGCKKNTSSHTINHAVGDAFGAIIGDPSSPDVVLRGWLYGILASAIGCVLAQDDTMLGQLRLLLKHWKLGHYHIGFDTRTGLVTAIVIVDSLD